MGRSQMRLFRKRKPKYKNINNLNKIKAHLREFIFDSQIPDAEQLSIALGCPTISDELLEKEETESDRRVETISFLIPLLYGYAALFTETFISTMVPSENDFKDVEKHLEFQKVLTEVQKTFEESAVHLLMGSISQLVDLELLSIAKDK